MTRGRLLDAALVVIAVLGLVAGIAVLARGAEVPAYADTSARQDVRAATERFAAGINTYDVTDLDPYVERMTPLMTDDLAEQFEVSTQDLLARFAEAKIVTKGTVDQVAIDSIDADSAESLAAITVTTKPENVAYGKPRLRWRVSLVREDGEWLVDSFADVAVEDEPAQDGSDQ
ncbi:MULTISPECIES: pilus assembly FimT family protein [Aeromicrobium]|uniref:Mce-associated membrane protein n=1 Tax=Aeromicrobium phoceense TaxID=2754045 RepID=A0A838XFM4_9ACTN|nr:MULTISPECIES: hypothetical protein [Aeromicrobium]MBA4607721.1 hypothetical protein [Aeromicrobium phoceense]